MAKKKKIIAAMLYSRNEDSFQYYSGEDVITATPEENGEKLLNIVQTAKKDVVFYVRELKLWGYDIVKTLYNDGYTDVTELDVPPTKMQRGQFSYLCAVNGTWYSISVMTWIGVQVKFAAFSVLASTEEWEDIVMLSEGMAEDSAPDVVRLWAAVHKLQSLHITRDSTSASAFNLWKYGRFGHNTYKYYANKPKNEKYYQTVTDAKGLFIDASVHTLYDDVTLDDWLRPAYLGGWCYKKPDVHDVDSHVYVYDVNSLYPWISTMRMPFGRPLYIKGAIPQKVRSEDFCVVHFRAQFYLKPGKLPFVRVQNNKFYDSRDILENSDIVDRKTGRVYDELIDTDTGEVMPIMPELTLTYWEYELFLEHYDVKHIEIIDSIVMKTSRRALSYYARSMYMERHKSGISPAEKYVWKILQNGLIGYFGRKREMRDRLFFDDKKNWIDKPLKQPSMLYLGVAVTSYARTYIVRKAQQHYDTFLYSDTDSLHLSEKSDKLYIGGQMGAWKLEKEYDRAVYYSEKVYCGFDISCGRYKLTYAGLPKAQREQAEAFFNDNRIVPDEIKSDFDAVVDYFSSHKIKDDDGGIFDGATIEYYEERAEDWSIIKTKTKFDLRLGKPDPAPWFKRTCDGKKVSKIRKKSKSRLLYEYWVLRDEL